MIRSLFFSLLLITLSHSQLCLAQANTAIQMEASPFFRSFTVNRFVFQNGLRLLVMEDHSSPTFAYQTWFKVGSKNESPGKTGLAHLFEHMMFKETKNMKEGEFDKLLEGAGAEGENAFTSKDYTAYIQELPRSSLELIIQAESDRMVNLIISESAFNTEREVVQNERRFRNENNPDGLMEQELFQLAFTRHPYHWPIAGYQADLEKSSVQTALNFYHTYYGPNHATIVAVGDVDSENVKSLVAKYYGSLPKHKENFKNLASEPIQKTTRRKTLKLNIQVEKLLMGYHIPRYSNSDIPILNVLKTILNGGRSSRLNRALVETGIATSVDTSDFEDHDPSLFITEVNLQKNKHAGEAEKIIYQEYNRLMKQPISNLELERAKNKLNFRFYNNLDSNFEKAYFLGLYESIGGHFKAGLEHNRKLQLVTAKDIQKIAQKYLNPKNLTLIQGIPK